MRLLPKPTHPKGESSKALEQTNLTHENSRVAVETFGGRVHVEWDPQAAVTPLGQLPFFIEFLKLGNLFEGWVEDCPLHLISNNAPKNQDILGTLLLSILSGHTRYAHITTLRFDGVNPQLLGMTKVISEDAMRRAFIKMDETSGIAWFQRHLMSCYLPLLEIPWILDVDTTVKVLYGKQEGAVVGYNPKKPGRPSHTYHSYFIANLRLVLDVEVQPGNQSASGYSAPDLWSLLERIPENHWPQFIRGDIGFGTDGIMNKAEEKGIPYLFKLRQSSNVKKLTERLTRNGEWIITGQGWEAQESLLQLSGWKKKRRVVVLRRLESKDIDALSGSTDIKQLEIQFDEVNTGNKKMQVYEYAALVTSLSGDVVAIAQHYRDRADCENAFDELKNQWGWSGFTTQDLKRCRLMSRAVALVYNWWNLFTRLAEPDKHLEAVTSRPLLLNAIGKQTSHAGQKQITISSMHGESGKVQKLINRIATFFKKLKDHAEQLTSVERWYLILSKAVEKYLRGVVLRPPILLNT